MESADDNQLFRKSLTIVPTPSVSERIDSVSESETSSPVPVLDEEESLTLDQSIAAHKYAGSYRLRFSTSESTIRNRGWTKSEAESARSTRLASVFEEEDPQELSCSSKSEIQEISLAFLAEGKAILQCLVDLAPSS